MNEEEARMEIDGMRDHISDLAGALELAEQDRDRARDCKAPEACGECIACLLRVLVSERADRRVLEELLTVERQRADEAERALRGDLEGEPEAPWHGPAPTAPVPLGPPKPEPFIGETPVREWVIGREPPPAREVVAPAIALGLRAVKS